MSKYDPLHDHLENLSQSEWIASFDDVERLINGPLPKSAYEYPAWWSNNPTGHSHARSWTEAGWMTEDVNISGRTVTFRKISGVSRSSPRTPVKVYGFMKDSVTILGDYDLTEPLGENWGLDLHE